jgi:hypothetical protein
MKKSYTYYPIVDLTDPLRPKLEFSSKKGDMYKSIKSFQHDERIKFTIETYFRDRTEDQNKFYWKVFVAEQIECFKEYWGEVYTKAEMHEWNKSHFWGEEKVIEATNEVIRTPGSSRKQNTVQWEDKLEYIRQWFRQRFDWEISYPDQQKKLKFKY